MRQPDGEALASGVRHGGRFMCPSQQCCSALLSPYLAAMASHALTIACTLHLQVVLEPSGAAGVAAALSSQLRERHPGLRHVGIILCGGNVDLCSRTPDFWQRWLQPSPAAS